MGGPLLLYMMTGKRLLVVVMARRFAATASGRLVVSRLVFMPEVLI